ncbi:MAG: hypothetical protein IJR64_04200 [Bacteroidales bacterium]|nr:hypothetical protein [Bacteroidales bacterium]
MEHKVKNIFDQIPAQLQKHEKKYRLSALEPGAAYRDYGNITPIEVKSSQRYTLTSIRKCVGKFGEYLAAPIVLHAADLKEQDGILFLPLYMTPLI